MTTTALMLTATLIVGVAWMYNRLVRQRNVVREAWSGVDVLLKQRHDLVPSLVSVVKAYATHEQATLEDTISARNRSLDKHSPIESQKAESDLNRRLVKVIALAESYPELKADEMFRRLMTDLVRVEDELQYARRYFNGAVRDMNNLVEHVPSNIVARIFRFERESFFELERIDERELGRIALNP